RNSKRADCALTHHALRIMQPPTFPGQPMKSKRLILLMAEMKESFTMGMSAVAAHKLRSALTLLGVMVGVFSIIVTMTAMRVMQNNIEKEIAGLGSQTFLIRKMPIITFARPEGMEKLRRRKNITFRQGMRF